MAKVRVWPGRPRPATFRTGVYFRSLGGQLIAQMKPRPRGRGGTPKQLENQAKFADARRAIRYMDANQVYIAEVMSRGFPQMPSDILMKAMLGAMGPLQFTNHVEMRSVGERDEVTDALDLLGRTQGGILVRRADMWDILGPSQAGHVLTTQGPDADPTWTPGAGGPALVNAVTLVDVTEYDWLNLEPGFEYEWVFADISTTGVDRQMLARISHDNGDIWHTSGYRCVLRWHSDTASSGWRTASGSILLGVEIGNSDDQTLNGVLRSQSDFGLSNTRKAFTGYSTTYLQTGKFYVARYAGSYEASKQPINAVKTFINGSEFSGKISLWRRPLP